MNISSKKILLWIEMLTLFVAAPIIATFLHISRWDIHLSLWIVTGYAVFHLTSMSNFSWRAIWQGGGWTRKQRRFAVLRFLIIAPLLLVFTLYIAPERVLQFPLEKPITWAVVMVLYPVLSALPQEFVYRSFFFERYQSILPKTIFMIAASAFCFGFVHIMFQNWIAPVFSGFGGVIFAYSYTQHHSLKWAAIEHAIYGCYVFTIGLGWYFYNTAGV